MVMALVISSGFASGMDTYAELPLKLCAFPETPGTEVEPTGVP